MACLQVASVVRPRGWGCATKGVEDLLELDEGCPGHDGVALGQAGAPLGVQHPGGQRRARPIGKHAQRESAVATTHLSGDRDGLPMQGVPRVPDLSRTRQIEQNVMRSVGPVINTA